MHLRLVNLIIVLFLTFSSQNYLTLAQTMQQHGQNNSSNAETIQTYHPKALELVIQGSIFDLNGEFNKALNAYNEALIYEPNSPSIYSAIAKNYVYLRKVDSAIQMLEKSIKIDPKYLEGHQLLATIYHRKGKIELAEKQYREIMKLDSTNLDATLNLASIYLSKNKSKEAAKLYERLIDLDLANEEIRFQLGNLYYKNQEYDEAVRVFKQYIRDFPEDEQGYLAVGAVMMAQKDTSEAIAWYKKVYEENVDFVNVRDELVSTLVAIKDWDTAVQIYEFAAKNDSTDLISNLRLGELYFDKNDTLKALSIFTSLTNSHPKDWRGFYYLAYTKYRIGKYTESIPSFQKAVELNKEPMPDAWFYLGMAYQQSGNLDAAEENLRKAQELAPLHPRTNFFLGNLLFQRKNMQDAIKFLNKSLESTPEKAPNKAVTLGTLAAIYDELGQHDKSQEYYEKALELDPENAIILNNYSYSLSERGERLEEALDMVHKAIDADPENGAFLDTIGWVYYKLGDYEKALEYIKESITVRDGSAEVFEHLGDVYEKLGQMDLATQYWKKAQEIEPDRESLIPKLKIN